MLGKSFFLLFYKRSVKLVTKNEIKFDIFLRLKENALNNGSVQKIRWGKKLKAKS